MATPQQVKTELAKEREAQATQITSLMAEINSYLSKIEGIDGEISSANEEMASLREVIAARKADSEKEGSRKEKLEAELKGLRAALEARQAEIKDKVTALARAVDGVTRSEILLREERSVVQHLSSSVSMRTPMLNNSLQDPRRKRPCVILALACRVCSGRTDKASKEGDVLSAKATKLAREAEEAVHALQQMVTEGAQRAVELKLRQEERERCVADVDKIKKTTEAANKKLGVRLVDPSTHSRTPTHIAHRCVATRE